jgi:nitrate reductase NapA
MSDTDRRAFLKRVAMASAAATASSLVPGTVFGEAFDAYVGDAARLAWRRAPCNLCGVGCGLLVGIENGRAVAVRGDPDSPVNKGLACARGYHSVQALYGRDRLTQAYVRREGRLVPVPMAEALDIVAQRLRQTIDEHGKDSVAIYGSGQWTMPAGYVASKLFKGALGTNNVEADARLSTSSASSGLMSTFGTDSPVGCFEDIDHAQLFVLWGTNLAETHPVLFSRLLERRQRDPGVRIIELTTRTTRTSYAADRSLHFAPHSDLAIANAICHELIARDHVNREFIRRHVAFRTGRTGIGYGTGDDAAFSEEPGDATWADYVRFLEAYTPERAQRISGMPASDIRWLASLYGDLSRRVMSLWSCDMNQHTRGTWINNLLYNIHLLTRRIATPGNSALPLADQASAYGSVHETGALTHRLPRGTVRNDVDRQLAANIWGVPLARIDPRPTHHALSMFRALDRGDVRFLWIQAANPMVTLPNLKRYRAAARNPDRFIVVSDAYPTPTTDAADVVLPAALWIEQEGLFGNAERRTQHFGRLLSPPGDAMGDAWQLIEVAKRLGFGMLFPWDRAAHVAGVWSEYSRFHESAAERRPPLAALKAAAGVMWPYVEGRETRWRYSTSHDPAADAALGEFDFYDHPDHRAWIWLRPYEPPPEEPDEDYPFWLSTGGVLEHAHSGTLTRRIPVLHAAVPRAYVELSGDDARTLGIRNGERVRLVSRRGALEIEARIDYRSQPLPGHVFVPDFDETLLINELTLDAYCPVSGTPDRGKCAVRVERIGAETL